MYCLSVIGAQYAHGHVETISVRTRVDAERL